MDARFDAACRSPARVNNSFRYTTPSFSGLKASFLVGAGEVTGGTTGSRLFDDSLRYTDHGLDALVSYVSDKACNGSPVADSQTDVGILTATAAYRIDAFRIEAGWLSVDDKRPADQDGQGLWVGGDYQVGPHVVRAQWVENDPSGNIRSLGKTNAYGVGYKYDLSRHTNLYTSLTRFQNDASADGAFVGRIGAGVPAGLTTATDRAVNEFVLGVRHAFRRVPTTRRCGPRAGRRPACPPWLRPRRALRRSGVRA